MQIKRVYGKNAERGFNRCGFHVHNAWYNSARRAHGRENHKGILSFDRDNTKIKTVIGILDIQGEEIEIVFIGGSTITISGKFKSLGYGVE